MKPNGLPLLITSTLIAVASCHEAVNPLTNQQEQEHHHEPPPQQQQQQQQQQFQQQQQAGHSHGQPHHIMDKNVVQDPEHMKEHLDGKIQKPTAEMTEEELQFHYFKVHDYDDNNMLDGVELIKALTHHHAEGNKESPDEPRQTDSELAQMVDNILQENDQNADGFIDYAEFLAVQRGRAKEEDNKV